MILMSYGITAALSLSLLWCDCRRLPLGRGSCLTCDGEHQRLTVQLSRVIRKSLTAVTHHTEDQERLTDDRCDHVIHLVVRALTYRTGNRRRVEGSLLDGGHVSAVTVVGPETAMKASTPPVTTTQPLFLGVNLLSREGYSQAGDRMSFERCLGGV